LQNSEGTSKRLPHSSKREWRLLLRTVKEQAAQIQKVSDRLELSKAAPQVVNSNQ
jgi:hypothetical protein